jgi:dihydropteroate synthase
VTGRQPAITLHDRLLPFDPPVLMGVLNVTPDSFSDGGRFQDLGAAEAHALQMVAEGAGIVDVGGESTRPGSAETSVEDELARVLPVVRRLARALRVPVSVDTRRAAVAERALAEGAAMINDVSGLADDPALGKVVAAAGVPIVLMHRRAASKDMYASAVYGDVVAEVRAELEHAIRRALECGVDAERILLDPGIGFSKKALHSIELLGRLDEIVAMGHPVVVGPSRKSFIPEAVAWAAAGCPDEGAPAQGVTAEKARAADTRIGGTAAAVAIAVLAGAAVLRVHDVAIMREAALVARAIAGRRGTP